VEQFILADVGSHVLDTARFLFGEADQLSCLTRRVNPAIRGEDVATVMMRMGDGVSVLCTLSYASRTEQERFPETFAFVECELGSVELRPGGEIRVTSADGTTARVVKPTAYSWANPEYAVVHASIVDCHRDLLKGLLGEATPETTADDNLRTVRLVHAAYESAATGQTIHFQ
jgi:D-apiose dehydrogenase